MSSAKTKNNLTDEQDLICREFYQKVLSDEAVWSQNTKTKKVVAGAVLNALGYTVSAGAIVPIGTTLKFSYGSSPDASEYAGIFDRDKAIVEGALSEADHGTDTDEAGPSQSPEGDEVGDVLLEDV